MKYSDAITSNLFLVIEYREVILLDDTCSEAQCDIAHAICSVLALID